MTNLKALIKFCEDLAADETVDILPDARREFAGLVFRSIGELSSIERELGPAKRTESEQRIGRAIDPIRARIFSRPALAGMKGRPGAGHGEIY